MFIVRSIREIRSESERVLARIAGGGRHFCQGDEVLTEIQEDGMTDGS